MHIHGGGIRYGSASNEAFELHNLTEYSATIGQPVIVASLNYRLGIFGFAASDDLKKAKSMNNGLRDQRMGMDWIKDHIADFGGNPERITAFGQSAGGTMLSLHTVSWAGQKGVPFNQLITFSGPAGNVVNTTRDATAMYTKVVAGRAECIDARTSEPDIECLRKMDFEELLNTESEFAQAHNPPYGLLIWLPSIDNDILPDRQSVLTRTGKVARGKRSTITMGRTWVNVAGINFLATWTQNEGSSLVGVPGTLKEETDVEAAIRKYNPTFSKAQIGRLLELYPLEDFMAQAGVFPGVSAQEFRAAQILKDTLFTCLTLDFTYQMARNAESKVHLGVINQTVYTPALGGAQAAFLGVIHGSDLPYVFRNYARGGETGPEHEALADAYATSIIAYAYSGSPATANGFADWPAAFETVESGALSPDCLNVEVLGGPWGSGPSRVCQDPAAAERPGSLEGFQEQPDGIFGQAVLGGMKVQQWLGSMLPMGAATEEQKALERAQRFRWEKLHRRCAYINTLQETMGM